MSTATLSLDVRVPVSGFFVSLSFTLFLFPFEIMAVSLLVIGNLDAIVTLSGFFVSLSFTLFLFPFEMVAISLLVIGDLIGNRKRCDGLNFVLL